MSDGNSLYTEAELAEATQFLPLDFADVISDDYNQRVIRILFNRINGVDERVKSVKSDVEKLSREIQDCRQDVKKVLEKLEQKLSTPDEMSQTILNESFSASMPCSFSKKHVFLSVNWNSQNHAMEVDKNKLLELQTARCERTLIREMLLALHSVEELKAFSLTGVKRKNKELNEADSMSDITILDDDSVNQSVLPPLSLEFISAAVNNQFPLRIDANEKETRLYGSNIRRSISASLQYIKKYK